MGGGGGAAAQATEPRTATFGAREVLGCRDARARETVNDDEVETVADLPMADRHETVLPDTDPQVRAALARAGDRAAPQRREALAEVAADAPTAIAAWAALATEGRDPVERYAYARVGYHRGLDALRGAGWGGRGYVRWANETNRPFLTCLVRLRAAAEEIGEHAEVERISAFLVELDPEWDDGHVGV